MALSRLIGAALAVGIACGGVRALADGTAEPFTGDYAGAQLELRLWPLGDAYQGRLDHAGIAYAVEAHVFEHELQGTFERSGDAFAFALRPEAGAFVLASGGGAYRLERRGGGPEPFEPVCASPGQVVHLPDPALKAAVLDARGMPETDVTCGDLADLVELSADDRGIVSLTGLQHARQLRLLTLRNDLVADLEPLRKVGGLQQLYLAGNRVTDVEPLQDLRELKVLDLNHNRVWDLGPLAGLTSLDELDLSNNLCADLTPLAGLARLEALRLRGNRIVDLEALAGMERLTQLSISLNVVGDEQLYWLSELRRLEDLWMVGTNVTDLTPLAGLTNLRFLDAEGNRITDLAPLSGLAGLKEVYVRDNDIEDLGPIVTSAWVGPDVIVDVSLNCLEVAAFADDMRDIRDLREWGVDLSYRPQREARP